MNDHVIAACKTTKDADPACTAVFVNELPEYLGASKREQITDGVKKSDREVWGVSHLTYIIQENRTTHENVQNIAGVGKDGALQPRTRSSTLDVWNQ